MLNDRREEQKIIEVLQTLISAPGGIEADYLIPKIICEPDCSLYGTVCCPILGFRAPPMSPTFRQRALRSEQNDDDQI